MSVDYWHQHSFNEHILGDGLLVFHYRGGLGVANAWQGRKTCNQSYQELSCKGQTLNLFCISIQAWKCYARIRIQEPKNTIDRKWNSRLRNMVFGQWAWPTLRLGLVLAFFANCLISSERLLFGNSRISNRNERVLDFGDTAAPLQTRSAKQFWLKVQSNSLFLRTEI